MDATVRELVSKVDGGVSPVLSTAIGSDTVEFTTAEGVFSFKNNNDNVFENEQFTVREVEHEAPAPLEIVSEEVVN